MESFAKLKVFNNENKYEIKFPRIPPPFEVKQIGGKYC